MGPISRKSFSDGDLDSWEEASNDSPFYDFAFFFFDSMVCHVESFAREGPGVATST